MRFRPTALAGVVEVETDPHRDARGAFARLYCPGEFAAAGIDFAPTQLNLSTNHAPFTLRGMHFNRAPHPEAKLVRVVRGRLLDVAVDIRPGSPTFGRHVAAELSADNLKALFLPEGIAHGFLTLEPDTHVLYQMGRDYVPGVADGIRFDDPALGIPWPAAPGVIADADRNWPDFAGRDWRALVAG